MPANALRSIACHDPDDERTQNGHEDDEWPQMVPCWRDKVRAPALEKEEVGKEANQLEQSQRHKGPDDADDERQQRDKDDAGRGGEITEFAERFSVPESLGLLGDSPPEAGAGGSTPCFFITPN